MKKKILIAAVLLWSIVLGLGVGVFAFSSDNIKNASQGYDSVSFSPDTGLEMKGWTESDGAFISGEDPQLLISGVL